MITKTIVIILMLIILASLGSGLLFLLKDDGKTNRTVKALTWRICLSLTLFLFILLTFVLGWIKPHFI